MNDISSLSARREAVRFLDVSSRRGIPLASLWAEDRVLELSPADQRFARELVEGVLRQKKLLDFYISRLANRPLEKIDRILLWILRTGLYQLKFMRVPDYAAVHESTGICRSFGKSYARSFVNGILRQFQRVEPPLPGGDSAEALSVRFSHPTWLVSRYLERWGSEMTVQLLERNNRRPEPVLWINTCRIEVEDFLKELEREGLPYECLPDLPLAVVVQGEGMTGHRLYREGLCFFMDASSQRVAEWMAQSPGRRLADLCAAPGNKSFYWRARRGKQVSVLSCDISESRLRALESRRRDLRIDGLQSILLDLREGAAFRKECFDAVLLDAPCSGLGTIRSNPDLRWQVSARDLKRHSDRQRRLFSIAFGLLRSGGEMIYSTCSTEPEENEEVFEDFLKATPAARPVGEPLRTYPLSEWGDGFFAAKVRRLE